MSGARCTLLSISSISSISASLSSDDSVKKTSSFGGVAASDPPPPYALELRPSTMLWFVLYIARFISRDSDNVTLPACDNEKPDPEKDSPSETGKDVLTRVDMEGLDNGGMIYRPQFRRLF